MEDYEVCPLGVVEAELRQGRALGASLIAHGEAGYPPLLAEVPDARLSTPVRQVLRDTQGVRIVTDRGVDRFDAVVMACHTDQALRLLGGEASANEREVLGAIRYQANRAVLQLREQEPYPAKET